MQLWGIDLGGTKIEGVVLAESAEVQARLRIPTEADRGYKHIVTRVEQVVALLEEETRLTRPKTIGIGTPGAQVPKTGLMKNCNTTCLNGKPLLHDLVNALGTHVRIANDADCFALAEGTLGAGRGYRTVFGVIMGTGVGGGIVVDGRLVAGPNGLTGEWGHTTLVPGGNDCYCGRQGCVETYLSGPSVERDHLFRTGDAMKLADIAACADCSDPVGTRARQCQETIDQMCENFGKALSTVVNVLDPDVIVLGGGAGRVSQLRTNGRDCLAANVFGPDFSTPLVTPQLGDSAGVFGAALLTNAWEHFDSLRSRIDQEAPQKCTDPEYP